MNRFLSIFSRLQWKLTFSYTLVTASVVIVLLLLLIIVAFTFSLSQDAIATVSVSLIRPVAEEAAPFLEQDPPDLAGLEAWVGRLYNGRELDLTAGDDGFQSTVGDVPYLLLFDRHGAVVLVSPAGAVQGERLASLPAGMTGPVSAALRGDTDPALLGFQDAESGLLFAAAPVENDVNEVVGAFLVALDLPVNSADLFTDSIRTVLPAALFVLVAAGVAGTFFGFVVARGFSRRLHRLTAAADSWSQGDFSVRVEDRSADEIGRLAQRLNQMATELQLLLDTRQELATLEERNRLARDLHDSVKQQVFAAAMQAGAARTLIESDPPAAKRHIEEAEGLARQSQRELSTLLQELRPAALAGKGLAAGLRDLVDQWSRQNSVAAQVRVQGERPLPLDVEQSLYRVTQEALANIARHSRAHSADVHLAWNPAAVVLTIRDDGTGFDVANAPDRGLGLRSMRERIEAIGGTLTIESEYGSGATLRATCPLAK